MSFPLLLVAIVSLSVILFYVRRSLRYLQFFQQEEYNSQRFINWWLEKRSFDTRGSIMALSTGAASLAAPDLPTTLLFSIVGGVGLIAVGWREADPRKVGKIKLNMTDRLTAIYQLSIALYIVFVVGILGLIVALGLGAAPILWLVTLTLIQSTPLWIMLANAILWPAEEKKQQAFLSEAKEILADYDPYVLWIFIQGAGHRKSSY